MLDKVGVLSYSFNESKIIFYFVVGDKTQTQLGFSSKEREAATFLSFLISKYIYFVNILEGKNTYMDPDTVVWSVIILLGIGLAGTLWSIYYILKMAADEVNVSVQNQKDQQSD